MRTPLAVASALLAATLALDLPAPAQTPPRASVLAAPRAEPPGYATFPPGSTPVPQTSAAPTAEPSPPLTTSPAPTGAPSASPGPLATPAPNPSGSGAPRVPRPLKLDHAKVGIVPGASLSLGVSGGTGALAVHATFDGVAARYDSRARRLILSARFAGTGSVTISDSYGDEASVDVLVGPPAGVVPSDVTVSFGGTVTPQFAQARVQAALQNAAQLQPGATLEIHGLTLPQTLRPGDLFDAAARVRIAGSDTFVEATGTTELHLRVETLDTLVPLALFYSDDPEKLQANDDGVLFRGTIDTSKPARVYLYHVSTTPDRRLYLAFQTTGQNARVQMLGYAAGPSGAYGYAGHVSTLQYLLERSTQESTISAVSDGAPAIVPIGYRAFAPLDLIDAIFDLRVLDGDPVNVEVISASNGTDPLDLLGGPELAGDGHGRRGEFALGTVPPLALSLAAGAPDPAPFTIGVPGLSNLRTGGRPLAGDYGVLRDVALQLSNPNADPQTIYFYELAQGGAATTTIWFDGDDRPTEIPCVKFPNRYTVRAFALAPNETRTVTGRYMTDGASSFPLLFGLTSTPSSPPPGPSSPDACVPKPSPTPTETPSPTPSEPGSPVPQTSAPQTSAPQTPAPQASPVASASPTSSAPR